jgi:hypothetical protein
LGQELTKKITPNEWSVSFSDRKCNDTTDFDIIIITWDDCENTFGQPLDSTVIELFASPNSNYYHFIATYDLLLDLWEITQDNPVGFTVFSPESCTLQIQGKDLLSGFYSFNITDDTGRDDTLDVECEFYEYLVQTPLSYYSKVTCEGESYLPLIEMIGKRKDDAYIINKQIYYQVTGVPGGYFPITGACNFDAITLTIPGNYVLRFFMDEEDITCLIPNDTIAYTYTGNFVSVEKELICQGEPIHLHALSLFGEETGFLWDGPNGYTSTNKDPVILNTTMLHDGCYTLYITGLECVIKDSVCVTVIPPVTGYLWDTICKGVRYTDHGFNIDPIEISDSTYTFYRYGLFTSEYHCDSTVCLYLTVYEFYEFTISPVNEICADQTFFTLPWNYYGKNMLYYDLEFNDYALEQGFANVNSGLILNANSLNIIIPQGVDEQDYVLPHNHYSAFVSVNDGRCKSDTIRFPFQISYPNWVIEQKWNDVIAVLNDRYNGGYTFSKYEWFKNGEKMDGEAKSYIYVLPTLDFYAEYRVLLTRDLDSQAFYTCPLIPEYRTSIKVYPQLVPKSEPVTIETQQDGRIVVWNILGRKIAQHSIYKNQTNNIYLNETGFLLLEVIQNNGYRKTFKIIVQ